MRFLPSWTVLAVVLGTSLAVADDPNLPVLQTAADKGDPVAQQELGRAYQLGEGVPVDFNKALDWYRKSAAQGNAKAMHNLGYMYHFGKGVTPDDKEASSWFLKAADKDLPAAELAVGMAYRSGTLGLTKDLPTAGKWLEKAAHHTEEPTYSGPAANVLGTLYEGTGMEGKPDLEKAVFWYTKAADLNYGKAQANLGEYYHAHKDAAGTKDLVTCYVWLRLASAQQESMAANMLTDMLNDKELTDAQIAEGDKRANAFRAAHNLPPMPIFHKMMTPASMMLGEARQKPAREPNAATTNALSAPGAPQAGNGAK